MSRRRMRNSSLMEIDAVVFDLGGVLVDVNYRYLYRQLLPSEEAVEEFLATICTPEWQEHHDRGRPVAEGVAELVLTHPEQAELIRAWDRRFPEFWGGQISGSVEVLTELREKRVPLYILTNWPAEKFPAARERFAFIEWFDGVLVSGEVGVTKPDPAIFDVLCRRFDLQPERTLFIDDTNRHVEVARELGFKTIRFCDPDQLRAELVELGVLGATTE